MKFSSGRPPTVSPRFAGAVSQSGGHNCRRLEFSRIDERSSKTKGPLILFDHAAIAAEVKAQLEAPVIAVGGMEVAEWAEAALVQGKCDLCAVGRQLIADADWPMKVRDGREDEIVHCTKCDIKCFGNLFEGIPVGCEENPMSGNEYRTV